MHQLRANGMTLTAIADELTTRGIARREGGRWEHSFISRLLRKTRVSACNGRTGPGQWFDDGVGQESRDQPAVALAVAVPIQLP